MLNQQIKEQSIISNRERQVLEFLANGWTTKEIAHQLYISTYTVDSHRKNVMLKLQARNITHSVVKAIRLGLVVMN